VHSSENNNTNTTKNALIFSNGLQFFALLNNVILLGFVFYLQNTITILQEENARLSEALATVTSELSEIKKALNVVDVSSQLAAVDSSINNLYATIAGSAVLLGLGVLFLWLSSSSGKGNNFDGFEKLFQENTAKIITHIDQRTHAMDSLNYDRYADLVQRVATGGDKIIKSQSTMFDLVMKSQHINIFDIPIG
jgi:hypothetical protein